MAKRQEVLFYISIILLIISIVIFSVNVFKFTRITGKTTGTANLTVEGWLQINFTTNNINWQSGSVTAGQDFAVLVSNNTVTDGNWTAVASGLVIENIGNINVTLALTSALDAGGLLAGTNPAYQWNVSNIEDDSCVFNAGTSEGVFYDVSTGGTTFCDGFNYNSTQDSVRVDILLRVPSGSKTGALGDTITATATAV
jgi:hypothetical protein